MSEPSQYSPELTAKLEQALDVVKKGLTVLILFEDMIEVNEHFQAVLEWCKQRGVRSNHRYQQGCYFPNGGMIYFVGADTHVTTRGVALELDLRDEAEELVRSEGLDARLRKAGAID